METAVTSPSYKNWKETRRLNGEILSKKRYFPPYEIQIWRKKNVDWMEISGLLLFRLRSDQTKQLLMKKKKEIMSILLLLLLLQKGEDIMTMPYFIVAIIL